MKVKDILDTIDNIQEVEQILLSADAEEGTHITYETVLMIRKLLHEYESDILHLDVIHK